MFTNKALEQADACRFCWMCRHVCPVGQVTGKESNNARAKGFLVSMDGRGAPLDETSMEIMYECTLCKACTNDCATGYDPSIFILEARTKAVVDGLVPPNVQPVLDRAMAGCMYQEPENDELAGIIEDLPEQADVLVFLGPVARRKQPQIAISLLSLLAKAGVSYTAIAGEPQSGADLGDLVGYVEEVKKAAEACAEAIRKTGAKTVVVLDENDAVFMKHQWAEWGIECGEIVTATACVAGLIRDGKLAPAKADMTACYHDPARIARDLEEWEPAREIIRAMGIELHELFHNKKGTKSTGGGMLHQTSPGIGKLVAEARMNDIRFAEESIVITSTPTAFDNLSGLGAEDVAVKDLFMLLDEAC